MQTNYPFFRSVIIVSVVSLFLPACARMMANLDTAGCEQRGGEVVNACLRYENGFCTEYQLMCSGGMTHAEYEEQRRREYDRDYNRAPATPPPQITIEESQRRRHDAWIKWLSTEASNQRLAKDARKYPNISWLASQWCRKGDTSSPPHHYIRVSSTQIGNLEITYKTMDSPYYKHYTHVQHVGQYYDLWDGAGYSNLLKKERWRRIEKISDSEYAVVYTENAPYGMDATSVYKNTLAEMAAREGPKITSEQHSQNPEIFVKCSI